MKRTVLALDKAIIGVFPENKYCEYFHNMLECRKPRKRDDDRWISKRIYCCGVERGFYSLGIDLEGAKEKIRNLLDSGLGYEAPEMAQAVQDYLELKRQWDELEQEFLKLKAEITGE